MSATTPARTASRLMQGAAAPVLMLELVASVDAPLPVWLAVVGGDVTEEPPPLADCAGVAVEPPVAVAVAVAATPDDAVAAASFSRPAVIVTGMKKVSLVMSVIVVISTPGSLASDPRMLAVHMAVCWSISHLSLMVLRRETGR